MSLRVHSISSTYLTMKNLRLCVLIITTFLITSPVCVCVCVCVWHCVGEWVVEWMSREWSEWDYLQREHAVQNCHLKSESLDSSQVKQFLIPHLVSQSQEEQTKALAQLDKEHVSLIAKYVKYSRKYWRSFNLAPWQIVQYCTILNLTVLSLLASLARSLCGSTWIYVDLLILVDF